ncbi:hypothetical protein AHF37_10698 [Paragonimus kellicotti]|nr:hypothetical protein AHF37_10698 [Paragonimus kellicotti]
MVRICVMHLMSKQSTHFDKPKIQSSLRSLSCRTYIDRRRTVHRKQTQILNSDA